MSNIFALLMSDLEDAIANDFQGRALTIINKAWGQYNIGKISLEEIQELADRYDEWVLTW